jgi:hypothetical protein
MQREGEHREGGQKCGRKKKRTERVVLKRKRGEKRRLQHLTMWMRMVENVRSALIEVFWMKEERQEDEGQRAARQEKHGHDKDGRWRMT